MYPDYNAMVNEFIRPVVSLLLFVFMILGWITAFHLLKENTILRIKLGKEDEKIKENFKIWVLRKSAPLVFQFYSFKTFLQDRQFYPEIKSSFKKKALKLSLKFGVIATIVASIFGIDTTSTS
jgi:hypothetical protein